MKISLKQFNFILTVVLVGILLGSILITLVSLSYLQKKSITLASIKVEYEKSNLERETGLKHKAELIKNKNSIELLKKIVPSSKDQAQAVAELLNIAKENGITIGSLTFPSSELGLSSTNNANNVTQAKPVEGINNILGIELTISQLNRKNGEIGSGISYQQLMSTLQSIEKNRRTMQIKNIQIQPIIKNNVVSGYSPTVTLNIFVKQ